MRTRRRLPLLYVIGQPLFVTFRLYDSRPANRPFPASNVTSGQAFWTMDRLLDQARCGATFLRQPAIAYGAEAVHYQLHSWMIRPNHVHIETPRLAQSGQRQTS